MEMCIMINTFLDLDTCFITRWVSEWVHGFGVKVLGASILKVEIWAIWRGFLMARELELRLLIYETYSIEAFSLVNNWRVLDEPQEKEHPQRIFQLKQNMTSEVRFILIQRESNSIADWMAKYGAHGNMDAVDKIVPPTSLQHLLQEDISMIF
ncbi:uncharacterized protein LOC107640638 [Arachis ipaensis]|uniref:RNase H type-1 domain-containing protein n=1 Tax=Arachis hypogaea TaxID=3818 RepID=A0A444Z527_ARAHY|nr:uncharacterized protein LOC107640638 [Arachis ipaensis]RYR09186.1 hypothetical protein Ahy_B05g077323 [Arachis hypogaea]